MREKKTLISVVEASRRSGLSLNYVYSLIRSGRIEATKIEGHWLLDLNALGARRGTGVRKSHSGLQDISA